MGANSGPIALLRAGKGRSSVHTRALSAFSHLPRPAGPQSDPSSSVNLCHQLLFCEVPSHVYSLLQPDPRSGPTDASCSCSSLSRPVSSPTVRSQLVL